MSKDDPVLNPVDPERLPASSEVNINTAPTTAGNDGWLKYIIAANATGVGSLVSFIVATLIFLPLGYYMGYKKAMDQELEIQAQADLNQQLDIEALSAIEHRHHTLTSSLKDMGFTDEEIGFLHSGLESKFSALKKKFTETLPAEIVTRYVPGKTVTKYIPRSDCGDDYLGDQASQQANDIILRGFNERASQK